MQTVEIRRATFKTVPSVYLIILKGTKVLLSKRANTGYEDGNYGLVAGHVESGESLRAALAREVSEEIGLEFPEDAIEHALTMYRFAPASNPPERMDFFFVVKDWNGEPENKEPNKCAELAWFDIHKLPPNTIPYIKYGLKQIVFGNSFCEFGFKMPLVKEITTDETLPLRSAVLRDGKPFDECRFAEDGKPGSFHLGYFDDEHLVGIASFYPIGFDNIEEPGMQLRGMAIDEQYQGKGIGKAILQFADEKIKSDPAITHIWCNARKIAYKFYESQGFGFVSEEFEIAEVGPHRKMIKTLKNQE